MRLDEVVSISPGTPIRSSDPLFVWHCHRTLMAASKTPLYEASTQFKNWRYSSQSLAKVRSSLNAAAVAVIRNTFEADEVAFSRRKPINLFSVD